MKFSLHVQTRISDWHFIKDLENLGYDAAWVPDTQMMWSDCYSTMALAAQNTSKIKIGTGVAIAGTRIAPLTAPRQRHTALNVTPAIAHVFAFNSWDFASLFITRLIIWKNLKYV